MKKVRENVRFPCQLATKVDFETLNELDDIALYEKTRRATLVRDLVIEKIRVYQRNPMYKRFKIQLQKNRDERSTKS